jgi:hypothetical protein
MAQEMIGEHAGHHGFADRPPLFGRDTPQAAGLTNAKDNANVKGWCCHSQTF